MAREALIDYGTTRNGVRQLRRHWRPDGPPAATVLIVHGIAEHCGRYGAVGSQMADAGFGVVSYDQRGHGATEGRVGYIEKFSEFLDDVEDHLANLRSVGAPVVLLGHSMGGLISATYAVSDRPQPDLMMLSGPPITLPVPKALATAAHKLAQLSPKIPVRPPFDPMVLSRDPAVADDYKSDPLIKGGGCAGLMSQMLMACDTTSASVDRIRIPTLCLHGGDDELVPPECSEVLEGLPGVERDVLDGLRHEIFNEPEGPDIVSRVIAWANAKLA